MSLLGLVERTIAILKKDPAYRFKVNYSLRQLLYILVYRGFQALRGIRIKMLIKVPGLMFCGRSVVVEHGYQITSGANLILEDMVHINALSEKGITFGRNVTVAKGTVIVCTGVVANRGVGLKIGDHSAIGAQSFLGAQGGITIGNDVIMGPGVRIFSENHNFNLFDCPIRKQGESRLPVDIEDDCWVGSCVTILGGVRIGSGTVIAAGSVVTKDIPKNSIVAGVPAKIIRKRQDIP